MPAEVWEQVLAALHDLEQNLDKRFGDPTSPLLLSCRSGAKFSMPGMMDTVLNIGLNDDTAKGLVALTGDAHFVFDSYRPSRCLAPSCLGCGTSCSRTC